jgi:predicted MFS family arabinose efflux permease
MAPGFVAAALCIVNIAFAWKWLPESKHAGERRGEWRENPVWKAAWSIVRKPVGTIPRLVWIYGVGMLAFSSMTAVLSLYLKMNFGFTEKTIGYVFLYIGLLSVLMRSIFLGPIVRHLGETWTMRLGAGVLILGLFLYPAAWNLRALIAVMPFVSIGTALLFPSTTALMSRASAKSETGTTMGIAQTYAGIARMAAPPMATFLFQRYSHGMPFYVAGITVGLVSILSFRLPPPQYRDETGPTP